MVVGEAVNFDGGIEWLRDSGVEVIEMNSVECMQLLAEYIAAHPEIWHEDIGEEEGERVNLDVDIENPKIV